MLRTSSIWLALLVSSVLPSTASAVLVGVSFEPTSPTGQDTLEVTVNGQFNDGCWRIDRVESGVADGVVTVEVFVVDTIERQEDCPAVVLPWSRSVEVGPLDPASYLLRVVEHRDSDRVDPTQSIQASLQVSVPTLPSNWSTLKSLYSD